MTVADAINRLQTNLTKSYSACEEKGATLPDKKNFDNLPATISSITGGGVGMPEALQKALLQTVGSVVGYNVVDEYNKEWEQPVLTANGTMGGTSFAVSASSVLSDREAYYAVANNGYQEGYEWHSRQGFPQWFEFYNPEPLRVSSLDITNRYSRHYGSPSITEYTIQASDEGTSWENIYSGTNDKTDVSVTWSIPVNSTKSYKYWRIYITNSSDLNYASIGELKINTYTGSNSISVSSGQCVKSVDPLQMVISPEDSNDIPISTITQGQTTGSVNDLYVFGKNDDFISYTFRICETGTAPVIPSGYDFAVKIKESAING